MSLMSWSSKAEDMAQQSKFQFMQGTATQNSRSALTACTPCLAQAPAGSGPEMPSICLTPLCCRHRDWCCASELWHLPKQHPELGGICQPCYRALQLALTVCMQYTAPVQLTNVLSLPALCQALPNNCNGQLMTCLPHRPAC